MIYDTAEKIWHHKREANKNHNSVRVRGSMDDFFSSLFLNKLYRYVVSIFLEYSRFWTHLTELSTSVIPT